VETDGNESRNQSVSPCVELETNDSEAWKRMGGNGGCLVSLSSDLAPRYTVNPAALASAQADVLSLLSLLCWSLKRQASASTERV
jgi:hypothetical protein